MRKIENVFVLLGLIFGLLFVFITPPFQSVDEPAHFFRAYGIASGDFIAQKQGAALGSYVPKDLETFVIKYNYLIKNINAKTSLEELAGSAKIKVDTKSLSFVEYPNTALYSPTAYIPQSIGVFIAKILHLPPLYILYVGRAFNLIMYLILGYYAIKILPKFKQAAFLILLLPMNLSLAASMSSDSSLIGVSVLYFAVLTDVYCNERRLDFKLFSILTIFAIFFALTKQYLFMTFFICLLPAGRLKKFFILLISFVAAILWSCVVKDLYVNLSPDANPVMQMAFMISNPFKYLLILLSTFIIKSFRLLITAVGVLGWQDTRLDIITYVTYPVLILLSSLDGEKCFSRLDALKALAITVFSYCVIVTLIYISWDKPGSNIVLGLNGKYFTPLLLPFLIAVNTFVKYKVNLKNVYIYGYTGLVLLSAVVSVLVRFYNIFPNLYYQV